MTDGRDHAESSVTTDEQRELECCKQEIAHLKQLVVQLSEIVMRNVVRRTEDRTSERL